MTIVKNICNALQLTHVVMERRHLKSCNAEWSHVILQSKQDNTSNLC